MAQGPRNRWMRVATTGLGVVLCTGLVGCMGWDKSKDTKGTSKVTPGLPGLQTLPPGGNNPAATKTGQPGFTGSGSNLQPAAGFGMQPTGTGVGRFGTDGINTNKGTVQPIDYRQPVGAPGSISAPLAPGGGQSQFGPVGAAQPNTNWNPGTPAGGAAFASPPPPSLLDPLPPPPPGSVTSPGTLEPPPPTVLPPMPVAPPPPSGFGTSKGG
jgi:hypothetical protein